MTPVSGVGGLEMDDDNVVIVEFLSCLNLALSCQLDHILGKFLPTDSRKMLW